MYASSCVKVLGGEEDDPRIVFAARGFGDGVFAEEHEVGRLVSLDQSLSCEQCLGRRGLVVMVAPLHRCALMPLGPDCHLWKQICMIRRESAPFEENLHDSGKICITEAIICTVFLGFDANA